MRNPLILTAAALALAACAGSSRTCDDSGTYCMTSIWDGGASKPWSIGQYHEHDGKLIAVTSGTEQGTIVTLGSSLTAGAAAGAGTALGGHLIGKAVEGQDLSVENNVNVQGAGP